VAVFSLYEQGKVAIKNNLSCRYLWNSIKGIGGFIRIGLFVYRFCDCAQGDSVFARCKS